MLFCINAFFQENLSNFDVKKERFLIRFCIIYNIFCCWAQVWRDTVLVVCNIGARLSPWIILEKWPCCARCCRHRRRRRRRTTTAHIVENVDVVSNTAWQLRLPTTPTHALQTELVEPKVKTFSSIKDIDAIRLALSEACSTKSYPTHCRLLTWHLRIFSMLHCRDHYF